jgi:aryl-alcohol dehydrogenase-like predicted oxidoreductase
MENIGLRTFGQSKILLSPIGLGTWQFSKKKNFAGKYWKALNDDEITEIVQVSLEGGINWFDTAEMYGNGESERSLSKALQKLGKKPDEIFIATKWWPAMRRSKSIISSINERLSALQGFPIDLYQIHMPFSFSSIKSEMKAMAKLVEEGKIKNIGVSNYSAKQMIKANNELKKYGLSLASNQVKYNLIDRTIEKNGILKAAQDNGIAIIAYSPLEQAILTGRYHDNPELINNIEGYRKYMPAFTKKSLARITPLINSLKEIAKKYNATAAQVALNWLINYHGNMVFAIPGATSSKQASSNCYAMNFKLSTEELQMLSNISDEVTK